MTSNVAARLAIFGGPGMGKTSLALAALHDPAVALRYGDKRIFVACDAGDGLSGCFSILCGALGISMSNRKAAERSLTASMTDGPSLLVLDNFESVWEAERSRPEAESVLQLLCAIDSLSLVVTLRGSEAPFGVAWTRPFVLPLTPLDAAAAKQVFLAIADVDDTTRPSLRC